MALGYTVNWIEQGRTPEEIGESGSEEVMQTQHRCVYYTPTGKPASLWRQSRSRTGTVDHESVVTYVNVTYRAMTVTSSGRTSSITQAQAAEIQADAYDAGCVSCSTSRIEGPNFEVTKVVRFSTPLENSASSTTTWGEWSEWTPPVPEEEEEE